MSLLYHYIDPQGYGGSQRLVPGSERQQSQGNTIPPNLLINVVEEYPWTLSPRNVKKFIPYIHLTEYRQLLSSELISLIRNIAGNIENALIAGANLPEFLGGIVGIKATSGIISTAVGAAVNTIGTAVAGRTGGIGGAVIGSAIPGVQALTEKLVGAGSVIGATTLTYNLVQNALVNTTQNVQNSNPYKDLYIATPTGFEYRLPFLSVDNMIEAGGKWGVVGKDGPIQATTETIRTLLTRGSRAATEVARGGASTTSEIFQEQYDFLDVFEKASKGILGAAPGTAAEQLKAFTPQSDGDSVKITFYLSNTEGTPDTIRRNWEFLYILTYQNLPNRRSINLLDPPCLYKVEIPGVKSFPVASIESLKVTNEGILRKVNIDTGDIVSNSTLGPNIKVVPEVYKVTLTVRSLLMTTQNLFYYNDKGEDLVSVRSTISSDTSIIKNLDITKQLKGLI